MHWKGVVFMSTSPPPSWLVALISTLRAVTTYGKKRYSQGLDPWQQFAEVDFPDCKPRVRCGMLVLRHYLCDVQYVVRDG